MKPFNEALCNMEEGVEHPLPVLVTFLARTIKKLRQIGASLSLSLSLSHTHTHTHTLMVATCSCYH